MSPPAAGQLIFSGPRGLSLITPEAKEFMACSSRPWAEEKTHQESSALKVNSDERLGTQAQSRRRFAAMHRHDSCSGVEVHRSSSSPREPTAKQDDFTHYCLLQGGSEFLFYNICRFVAEDVRNVTDQPTHYYF